MKTNIILLGPLAVGKSTVALRLSEKIGQPNFPVDRLKWYYRLLNGYNLSEGTKVLKTKGFGSLITYASKYFGVKELENILISFKGVIDLGATDAYCDEYKKYEELKALFDEYPNVFLLLPSESLFTSQQVLIQRLKKRYQSHDFKREVLQSYLDKNNEFVEKMPHYGFAKHIIYTENKTVDEICDEILIKSNQEQQTFYNVINNNSNLNGLSF